MNKKILWFLGFLVVAAVSCWATSSSFILMMPALLSSNPVVRAILVSAMVLVFFVLASYAFKLVVEAIDNDGTLLHPKRQFWGGLLLFIFTWIIISLPTNVHTFFYNLKVGDVVIEDLAHTKKYARQIAEREGVAPEYYVLENKIKQELYNFEQEVLNGTQTGFGQIASKYITRINNYLPQESKYQVTMPVFTKYASRAENSALVNKIRKEISAILDSLKWDKYIVDSTTAQEAAVCVEMINNVENEINEHIVKGQIADKIAKPCLKRAGGVLEHSYATIKTNAKYVEFDTEDDKENYTAANIETRFKRFLNPYIMVFDYFKGRIPFSFTFWLLLSILIDVSGFFFYYQATKQEF